MECHDALPPEMKAFPQALGKNIFQQNLKKNIGKKCHWQYKDLFGV